jgi:acyl carrier protein phosphodiesterase
MNFLAHAWLSFGDPEILVGNLVSDFIKGKKQYEFAPGIRKGIRLHRAIDEFTDTHPATKKMKSWFRPAYRLYSGPLSDIVYDHFLALDPNEFAREQDLKTFSGHTYRILDEHYSILPRGFQRIYPFMKSQDWLFHYREKWLIEKSFRGLERRAAFLEETGTAYKIFCENIPGMQGCYGDFFPQLKKFATHTFQQLQMG